MMNEETFFSENINIFCCPRCRGNLGVSSNAVQCPICNQRYTISDNIPLLYWPNEWDRAKEDVTNEIMTFYNRNPFPKYEDSDTIDTFIDRSKERVFVRLLDEQIPTHTRILEVGCGTGQLSNFLSISNRVVFGTDISQDSLKVAQEFKEKNELENSHFFQMNLFRQIFKPESFDYVICNGVLHHTSDPFLGFKTIAQLVKPGGYILIGLYNRHGRIPTDLRRIIFKVSGGHLKFLDPVLRAGYMGSGKKNTWFLDQYRNPHESKHTIGSVLRWFEQTGFQFIKSIPKSRPTCDFSENERLFEPEPAGNRFEHFLVELGMLISGGKEGGLFVMIGRKTNENEV